MDRVAIYCRLSDEDKDKALSSNHSESIQNQKLLLVKYSMQNKWDIHKIYIDDDYSGLDNSRPEFNKMINHAREGKFNIILCKHQSRFSRDIEVIEKYLHRKFPQWGIRFVSITDNVDTQEKRNKKSRQINSLVNEWYCEDISEAIRATFKIKREEGKFIGSFAPYGYCKDESDKNKLVIDDEAAETVRQIFNMYLEGHGTQSIARKLNEIGIPNPTTYKIAKGLKYKNVGYKDTQWNKTTIRRILRDEVYIGNMVQGKREKLNYKSDVIENKPRDTWIIVRDTHEHIIEEEDFYQVQSKMDSNIKSDGRGRTHIFAGKVRCLNCGSTMHKTKSHSYSYLRCSKHNLGSGKEKCTGNSMRLDFLEKEIEKMIRQYYERLSVEKIAHLLLNNKLFSESFRQLKSQLKTLRKEIEEIDLLIKKVYIDRARYQIDDNCFNTLINEFLNDKERLLLRHKFLKKEIEIQDKQDPMEKIIKKYKDFKTITHGMVNELIELIEIGVKNEEGIQRIIIHWKF